MKKILFLILCTLFISCQKKSQIKLPVENRPVCELPKIAPGLLCKGSIATAQHNEMI